MSLQRLDPAGLAPLPGSAHLTIAAGSRIVHVSGQTGVDSDGRVVGTTHREQAAQAFANLAVAMAAVGATEVARLGLYVVDYSDAAFEGVIAGAVEVFGEDLPLTATTMIGVATLWQPDLLFEVDAVLVLP